MFVNHALGQSQVPTISTQRWYLVHTDQALTSGNSAILHFSHLANATRSAFKSTSGMKTTKHSIRQLVTQPAPRTASPTPGLQCASNSLSVSQIVEAPLLCRHKFTDELVGIA